MEVPRSRRRVTTREVLDACPRATTPASVIVRAAHLYLGAEAGPDGVRRQRSSRDVARSLAAEGTRVHARTVSTWIRSLGIGRDDSATALIAARHALGRSLQDEIAACAAYTRGETWAQICEAHGLSTLGLSQILSRHGVALRGGTGQPSARTRAARARRAEARRLDRLGKTPAEIADRLGVEEDTVRHLYLRTS